MIQKPIIGKRTFFGKAITDGNINPLTISDIPDGLFYVLSSTRSEFESFTLTSGISGIVFTCGNMHRLLCWKNMGTVTFNATCRKTFTDTDVDDFKSFVTCATIENPPNNRYNRFVGSVQPYSNSKGLHTSAL